MAENNVDLDQNYGVGVAFADDPDFVPLDQLFEEEGKGKEEEPTNVDEGKNSKAEGEGESEPGQGRQEEDKAGGDTNPQGQGSPDNVPPSSIALALLELKKVGALSTLDDTLLEGVKDASEIKDIIQKEVENLRSEDQKRIAEALGAGVQPTAIQFYEQQTKLFNDYDESLLDDESDKGEAERRKLIAFQYKLKGMADEDIERLVNLSFESGKDVDDSKKALQFCRDAYSNAYKKAVADAKDQQEKQIEANRKHAEEMRTSVMEGKGYFDDLKVDKDTRAKIYDYIGKPEYDLKDADGKVIRDGSGRPVKVSGLTKYCREHLDDANRLLATILVLTNEGKDFGKLIKGPVSEEAKRINKNLEDALINGTRRTKEGAFKPEEGISQSIDFDSIAGLAPM